MIDTQIEQGDLESDGETSDDEVEGDEDDPWFSMGMEARKPWRLSVIVELVRQMIGYQYLLR